MHRKNIFVILAILLLMMVLDIVVAWGLYIVLVAAGAFYLVARLMALDSTQKESISWQPKKGSL